jgi:hypothetical protein
MSKKIRAPQKTKDYRAHNREPVPEWKDISRQLRQKHIKQKVKYKQQLLNEMSC